MGPISKLYGPRRSKKKAIVLSITAALALALTPGLGAAQETPQELPNHLYRRFELSASTTLLILGTTIRVDPDRGTGTGTEVTVEDELGISRTTMQPRAALRWRPGRRHELEGGFLRAVRSGDRVLTDTIAFRDTTFAAGLRTDASIGTSQTFLTYRYSFTAKERTQLGAAVGLGIIFFRSTIDAVSGTTTGGADTTIREFSSEENFNGPTASLGLFGRFQLGDRWYLESDVRGIYVKVDNFRAGVIEAGVAGRYFFNDVIGAELGYGLGFYAVRVDRASDGGFLGIDLTGKLRYTVQGIRLGLVIAFK